MIPNSLGMYVPSWIPISIAGKSTVHGRCPALSHACRPRRCYSTRRTHRHLREERKNSRLSMTIPNVLLYPVYRCALPIDCDARYELAAHPWRVDDELNSERWTLASGNNATESEAAASEPYDGAGVAS